MEGLAAYEPFLSLAVALGVGFLIGLQREQTAPPGEERSKTFLGGARTYPLFALAGALSFLLGGVVLGAVVLGGSILLLAIGYRGDVQAQRGHGLTSEAALVVTFLLGALAAARGVVTPDWKRFVVVAGAGVAVTFLLTAKGALHGLAGRVSREDVFATLKLLIVSVIVLPLLPDQTYDALDVLNPFQIGVMVVLVAAIGFAAYVAIRVLGPNRGIVVTGLVGGLVSSTAVTLSFAGRARTTRELAPAAAVAVVLASTLMLARVLVIVGAVEVELLEKLALPFGCMLAAGLAASAILWRSARRHERPDGEVRFSNPFALGTALKFGALFTVVLLASKAASVYLGEKGTYAAGALGGLTDVDAITLSMAQLAGGNVPYEVAATTIVIGAASNTAVKAGLALGLGGWAFGRRVLLGLAGIVAGAGAGLALLWA